MFPNQFFLSQLSEYNQEAVISAFEQGLVRFRDKVVVAHTDGSELEFEWATLIADEEAGMFIVITENFGYIPFTMNDPNLFIEIVG